MFVWVMNLLITGFPPGRGSLGIESTEQGFPQEEEVW